MDTDPCQCSPAEVQQLLCELLDPGVSAQRAEAIRKRLAQCPECVERFTTERQLRTLMQRCCSAQATAPVYLRERITTQIRIVRRG
ncbi:anti-sigma factor [Corynebacterium tapiri]|uniref:Anti-sigma factor n=1 Tax=Corynebacterium tapiri TaxID=1448266 RepID=A0A5C4U486_9CORY|nr:anti-sigma factor [Corynebacterium tapiri]TNL98406.1 anti-sigma factor [Corynebacterium tapiri]